MKLKTPYGVALGIFTLSFSAHAAAPLCIPFSAFKRAPSRCEDNYVLGDEALNCVEKYYKHVQNGRIKIKGVLDKQVAKMKEQQNDSFDRTDAGYQDTQKQLQGLIADGELAKLAVTGYGNELFFPEDYDQPQHTGMTQEYYLSTEPCYAVPNSVIKDSQKMISKIISDLKAVDVTADSKKISSQDKSKGVQVLNKGGVSTTYGKSAPGAIPKGNSKNGASDITGAKKAADDAAKSKAILQQPSK